MNKSKSYKDMYNSINARVDTLAEALSVVNPAIDRVWVAAAIDNHFDGRAVDYNNPYLSRKADAPVVTNVVKFTPATDCS